MTVETTHQGADFVRTLFGPTTQHDVFITSLANSRDEEGERPASTTTRGQDAIERFCKKWDRAKRGLFFCVGTLKPGQARRAKENISELIGLHADIDLKSIEIDGDEVVQRLGWLRLPPSVVVASGGGYHAYWLFPEGLPAAEFAQQVEAALRLLADTVGGDPQVCEIARLMRLPGTHNTKQGGWAPVTVVSMTPARYELDDLEAWLAETAPIIQRKASPTKTVEALGNPFLAVAERFGFKPPIDVEQRLAAMSFGGAGDTSVHHTQLQVSASLLSRGTPLEEVVAILTDATHAAAGSAGNNWNWVREERAIRNMCEAWQRKNPTVRPSPVTRAAPPREVAAAVEDRPAPDNVVAIAAARKTKPAKQNAPAHLILGQTVITVIRERGDDLMFTPKGAWRYVRGLWSLEVDGLRAWLDVEIETACRALDIESTNRVVSETRQWIVRNPDLWQESVEWDAHGKIPTRSGLIDPLTLRVEPATAAHYCTWRIECDYDPAARCPWWGTMLADFFGDRLPAARDAHAQVIQEVLGAALIDIKPRSLSKALILQGGSNFGKSGILEVLGGLFGDEQISTGLEALEGSHGLMAFTRRLPWVLHEAFDQRKWHFSSVVKAIVTGEPVAINIKNGPMLSTRIKAPIFWGTNHPPQFREATKAIINRMIVIECRREFIEGQLVGAAKEAAARGYDKPSSLVLDTEMPGLLNWAIAGLRRAAARGYIELTDEIRNTADDIRRDSNLVAGFVEECVLYDPDRRVSVPDFCAAFSVWWLENKGEDRRLPSNDSIGKAMIALSDPRIGINPKELRDNQRRYYVGMKLNDQGIGYWRRAAAGAVFEGKTATTTAPDGEVNSAIPAAWDSRGSVLAMRLRQAGDTCRNEGLSQVSRDPPQVSRVTEPVSLEVSPCHLPADQVSPDEAFDPLGEPLF